MSHRSPIRFTVDLGNLEARLIPEVLCQVPQEISEQFLWSGNMHRPAGGTNVDSQYCSQGVRLLTEVAYGVYQSS